MTITFGSLFAGIGGLDLGLENCGCKCKWQVELDEYARRVLAKHWPDVRRWDDIRSFPPEPVEGWEVDLICGGFPCQDISYAGNGAGLDGERSGLFFELIRVVRQLRPKYVLLENVATLLSRGLDRVLGTLAEVGYDAEWHCVPAAYVGAPHIRDRIFVIAHANSIERIRGTEVGIVWGANIGVGDWWKSEPDVGRVAHGVPNRVDRLRCLGNAVVPQVAEFVARKIMENRG